MVVQYILYLNWPHSPNAQSHAIILPNRWFFAIQPCFSTLIEIIRATTHKDVWRGGSGARACRSFFSYPSIQTSAGFSSTHTQQPCNHTHPDKIGIHLHGAKRVCRELRSPTQREKTMLIQCFLFHRPLSHDLWFRWSSLCSVLLNNTSYFSKVQDAAKQHHNWTSSIVSDADVHSKSPLQRTALRFSRFQILYLSYT